MPVDAVSGPKFFTSRKYTDNGNEYRSSNYGRIAGTTLGAGAGTYIAVKGAKIYKEVMPMVEQSGITKVIPGMIDAIGQSQGLEPMAEEMAQELPDTILKYGKKTFKGAIAGLAAGAVLLGLGIGAMGDGITNIIERKHADNAAKADAADPKQ